MKYVSYYDKAQHVSGSAKWILRIYLLVSILRFKLRRQDGKVEFNVVAYMRCRER